jgi:hypothetical protein
LDISCNQISESNAETFKDSLQSNPNIVQIDVRANGLTPETVDDINEIVLKNYLKKNKITYNKLGNCKCVQLILTSVEISRIVKSMEEEARSGDATMSAQKTTKGE